MDIEDSHETALQFSQTFTTPLLVLLTLTLATQLASLAYNTEQGFASILLPSVIGIFLVTTPLAGLGLWMGQHVGLGTPLLTGLLIRQPGSAQKLIRDARLAIALGLGLGAFLLMLRILTAPYLPPELPELGHRGALGGLLVSASAAIAEEIWLRLGVMTMLAWLLLRLLGYSKLRSGIAWTAIVLAAFLFGLVHLPQLAAVGAATPIGIIATIFGNTLVGVVCGWFSLSVA